MRHPVRPDRFPRKTKKILDKRLFTPDVRMFYIDEAGYPTLKAQLLILYRGRRLWYGHRHVLDCER